jgi:hypothetical protein
MHLAGSLENPPTFEEIVHDIGVVVAVHLTIALMANLLVAALPGG